MQITVPNTIGASRARGDFVRVLCVLRFAAKTRVKPTAVIDLALAKLAQQEGFAEPPRT
jgi:hypothetical protein